MNDNGSLRCYQTIFVVINYEIDKSDKNKNTSKNFKIFFIPFSTKKNSFHKLKRNFTLVSSLKFNGQLNLHRQSSLYFNNFQINDYLCESE